MALQVASDPLVHSYDTELHAIRCGVRGQSGSTKHASGVTCPDCLRLLDEAARSKAERG